MPIIRVAIVGAGVIGISSALALLETFPFLDVTIISDQSFTETVSFGPAGLFRLDNPNYSHLAKTSFARFVELHRTLGGAKCGVQLISGHILSDNYDMLKNQEKAFGDIVYNFRWLKEHEMDQFASPSKYAIHYTAFTTEGRVYVPWMTECLKQMGANFERRKIESIHQLSHHFDVVVNCAGLNAGILVGDDSVLPIRGVLFEIEAPWHKHFLYRDLVTLSIPGTKSVFVGTVKKMGIVGEKQVNDTERTEIWSRLLDLMPTLKDATILSEWIGVRPHREPIRLEFTREENSNGKAFFLIHNYGHGSNGFTLSWGCAQKVCQIFAEKILSTSAFDS